MKADLLIGLDEDGGGFTLGFQVLGPEFVGKHFSGQFRAGELHSYLVDWGMWPLAKGKMKEALEAAGIQVGTTPTEVAQLVAERFGART